MLAKQIRCSLSYIHQSTDIGLEIRSQDELDAFVKALQDQDVAVAHLHNQHRDITLSIYLRFREGRTVATQQEEVEAA